jgi:histone deacetylase 1/2
MDDESYRFVFEPIMQKVMESFQPGAVVVCGGADSLSGDRLGCFNLSLQGHAACMDFLAKFGVPLLVLGGGGYTMRNVARCWCYETGRLLGLELDDELPASALAEYDYYMDTHKLRIAVSNMRNANTRDALEHIQRTVLANLAKLPPAPSVPIQEAVAGAKLPDMGEGDPDVRGGGGRAADARAAKADDGYGSDAEAGARHADADVKVERVAVEGAAAVGGGADVKPAAVPAPGAGPDETYLATTVAPPLDAAPAAVPATEAVAPPPPVPADAAAPEPMDAEAPAPAAAEPHDAPAPME